jgi:beta-alanine--pyruvate transaminase
MPFTANSAFKHSAQPRIIGRSAGIFYYAEDGRELIDGMCGLMSSPCGHSRPEIARAVARQLEQMSYVSPFQNGHRLGFALAERLAALAPAGLSYCFFTNSGSESVDTAMKIALAWHRKRGDGHRTRFVSRERGYHGVNFGGMALGGIQVNRDVFGPGLPGVVHMRHTWLEENRFSHGQPPHGKELAEDLARLCAQVGGHNIAACFLEPVAGSTGVLVPPAGYLERVREICDEHGILLVFDEVITGFGRLGENFGAQRFGVTPDMMTIAKGLTNGSVPMGAVMVSDRIYEVLTDDSTHGGVELFHGYTYSAHPVACAAAMATLDIFEQEQLVARARALEAGFQQAVHTLDGLPVVTDVRGLGMMAGIDLAPLAKPGARGLAVIQTLYDAGVMVKFTGDTMLIGPALTIEPDDIERLVSRIGDVLASCPT